MEPTHPPVPPPRVVCPLFCIRLQAGARTAAEIAADTSRTQAADALVANSSFAVLFQELCLKRAAQEQALKQQAAAVGQLSPTAAAELKKEVINAVVTRNRHRALAVQLDVQHTLDMTAVAADGSSTKVAAPQVRVLCRRVGGRQS
jgi:hypothetical protein